MTPNRLLHRLCAATISFVISLSAVAEQPPSISDLSYIDNHYMEAQRNTMDDLARSHLGSQFNDNKQHDLALLQRILDSGLVKPQQTEQLQAMGVILGDLLAADLDMDWVVYEDRFGRSRALRYRQGEEYLFPITMISRRREVDNDASVADIYQKAYDIIQAVKPPLPFQ